MKSRFFKEFLMLLSLLAFCVGIYYLGYKLAFYQSFNPSSLSETTTSLLSSFTHPINMTLYTPNEDKHRQIKMLVEQYQAYQPNIVYNWQPSTTQSPIMPQHALVLTSQQSKEVIDLDKTALNENSLSNALFKLQRKPNQWIVFLSGHDEPSIYGTKMRDLTLFRQGLENQGLKLHELNLSKTPFIPDNTNVLVIASNQEKLSSFEEKLILEYLAKGKNLLWLMDPQSKPIPQLSELLGITLEPGTIVDLHGAKIGSPHPAITIIDNFPQLPFSLPSTLTAFPFAGALHYKPVQNFEMQPFLITHESSWTESDITKTQLSFDSNKNQMQGPLNLGIILTEPKNLQRIIVIGNSRFINNGAIENYGNLALGLNLISWLNHDEELLNIQQPIVIDNMLYIQFAAALMIQYGFPIICLLLLICSIGIFMYRKKNSDKMAMLARTSTSRIE